MSTCGFKTLQHIFKNFKSVILEFTHIITIFKLHFEFFHFCNKNFFFLFIGFYSFKNSFYSLLVYLVLFYFLKLNT